jgi:hypothetical protein
LAKQIISPAPNTLVGGPSKCLKLPAISLKERFKGWWIAPSSQTLLANSLQTDLSNALEFKPIYQINPAFQPES